MAMPDTKPTLPLHRATLFWAGALPWTLIGAGLLLLGASLVARTSLFAERPWMAALLVAQRLAGRLVQGLAGAGQSRRPNPATGGRDR